jgi:hypothetical protein
LFKRRTRTGPVVKYYIYVSDAKLDMLFEQIDQKSRRRISAELKIDFKIASVTLTEAEFTPPTRTAKLQIVENFIRSASNLGTVESPGTTYFCGNMLMSWEWVNRDKSGVWFQGNTRDGTELQCVGLGGSRRHVLGETQPPGIPSATGWPSIREMMMEKGFPERMSSEFYQEIGAGPDDWLNQMYYGDPHWLDWLSFGGNLLELDFLAIPLLETIINVEGKPVHVVVGTPIYVAKA